jgi:hypothetical protein
MSHNKANFNLFAITFSAVQILNNIIETVSQTTVFISYQRLRKIRLCQKGQVGWQGGVLRPLQTS